MPLPSSGTISMQQLSTEFGDTTPNSLSEFNRGGSLVPNTSLNTNIPTTIGVGNPASLSNYYSASATTLGYTTSSSPSSPVPYSSSNVTVTATLNMYPLAALFCSMDWVFLPTGIGGASSGYIYPTGLTFSSVISNYAISNYGAGGTLRVNVNIGSLTPTVYDITLSNAPFGTVLSGNYCYGNSLVRDIANGSGGFFRETIVADEPTCGPPLDTSSAGATVSEGSLGSPGAVYLAIYMNRANKTGSSISFTAQCYVVGIGRYPAGDVPMSVANNASSGTGSFNYTVGTVTNQAYWTIVSSGYTSRTTSTVTVHTT